MKKLVLSMVAFLLAGVATQASAYNMIHPFYMPEKGKAVSTTSFDFTKAKWKDSTTKGYARNVNEEIEYGLTNAWSVFGEVGRDWVKFNDNGEHWKNNSWGLGTSYDVINDGKNYLNVWGEYWQQNSNEGGADKYYNFVGMYGYNFDWATPFMVLSYANTLNYGRFNDEEWLLTGAAYKELTKDVGLTLGVRFTRDQNEKTYYGITQLGYQITKDIAIQGYGNYMLNNDTGREFTKRDKEYTVGLKLNLGF